MNNLCGSNADCTDKASPPFIDDDNGRTCTCKTGFEGNATDVCTDINACESTPCDEQASSCTDFPPPDIGDVDGRVCGQCNTGFIGEFGELCVPEASVQLLSTTVSQTADGTLVVGEKLTLEVNVTVPEVAQTVNVSFDLSYETTGVHFVNPLASVLSFGANVRQGGMNQANFSVMERVIGGNNKAHPDRVTISFGQIGSVNDSEYSPDDIIQIQFSIEVRDDLTLVNAGTNIETNVTVTLNIGSQFVSRVVEAVVVQPVLSVTPSVSGTVVDAGDVVLFTVNITHAGTSSADAFDVTVVEQHDLILDISSIVCTPTGYLCPG